MILTEESVQEIKKRAARYPHIKSAILPALTIAYRQVGHVDDEIYKEISSIIGIPKVEIAEAATFYTMFPKKPRGKYLLQVCNNISCALMGSDAMIKYLEEKLDIKLGETTDDKMFTMVGVECLGSCSTAPMIQVNMDYHENLNKEKVDKLIDDLRNNKD
ncbi:MAG: NADH-quinone oxidoreductase subunit NuoE [Calditrichaeota bacterium]|nr:MAG: NADH-quinone oxidoreductase subunit NuoE [Calditrichota bacterium]